MKPINEMKLSFEGRSCNESFARSAVAAFVAVLDPNMEELSDIKTAVSEAVTNCMVHGYRDKIGTVYIHAKIFEGARVSINIKDRGCGIADVKKAAWLAAFLIAGCSGKRKITSSSLSGSAGR